MQRAALLSDDPQLSIQHYLAYRLGDKVKCMTWLDSWAYYVQTRWQRCFTGSKVAS
jgi:hypothetical protein